MSKVQFATFFMSSVKKITLVFYVIVIIVAIRNLANMSWVHKVKGDSQSNARLQSRLLTRPNNEKVAFVF